MSKTVSPGPQRSVLLQRLSAPFDAKRPWRREFLTLRLIDRMSGTNRRLSAGLHVRFTRLLDAHPEAVGPYLGYAAEALGSGHAQTLARELAIRHPDSPAHLVALAQYWLARGASWRARSLAVHAIQLDPDFFPAFEIEALIQRNRGNLHQELQAVEQCIRLAPTPLKLQDWRLWLGEAYLRQSAPEKAWPRLEAYVGLPRGDHRAFHAAYCAVLLGDFEEAATAYAHAAPARTAPYDLLRAAEYQLAARRDAEVLRLLEQVPDERPEFRTLRYSALLRSGRLEEAAAALASAAQSNAPEWVQPVLAQLAELSGSTDALAHYRAMPAGLHTPLTLFRRAALEFAEAGAETATSTALAGDFATTADAIQQLHDSRSEQDLDPAIPTLIDRILRAPGTRIDVHLLAELAARASSQRLLTAANSALARALTDAGEWDQAWRAICKAQERLLPAISLTTDPGAEVPGDASTRYAEQRTALPIEPETVVYESFHGATVSCNPYALCRYLLSQEEYDRFTHVWIVGPNARLPEDLLGRRNVVFLRKGSPAHVQALATAGTLINNSTFEGYFARREGQRYLNTWHGIPWKKLGKESRSEPFAYGNVARNMLQATHIVAPDAHTMRVLTEGMDVDMTVRARLALIGSARNDLSTARSSRERIRRRLDLQPGQPLVLFMPTWKGLMEDRNAETDEVLHDARTLQGPGYRLMLRAHHFVRQAFLAEADETATAELFVPEDIETNELLGAADVVVTDFSSVLFDAAAAGIPVVKLLHAQESYAAARGLYFSAEEVPGHNASTPEEARQLVLNAIADREAAITRSREAVLRFGGFADGRHAERTCRFLFTEEPPERPIRLEQQEQLLLSVGGLSPNGITRALRSLLGTLQGSPQTTLLISPGPLSTAAPETVRDIRGTARLSLAVGGRAGTRMEREVLRYFSTRNLRRHPVFDGLLRSSREHENRRLFGDTQFAAAVDFDGYDSVRTSLIGLGVRVSRKRGIILHSEIWKEITSRFPRVQSGLRYLDAFDFAGSVSNGVRNANRDALQTHLSVPTALHRTVENTINVPEILEMSAALLGEEDEQWYALPGAHVALVGRLSPEKNHEALLRALAACRDRLARPVLLTFLGDGPLRLKMKQTIAELGLDDTVRLRGLVSNPYSHLRAADALYLPSLHEGQPLVILESLTTRTPVVASDIPGSRSVLKDGEYGTLVPLSHEGLMYGLERIAADELVPAEAFDPVRFTEESRQMFLEAIGWRAPSPAPVA